MWFYPTSIKLPIVSTSLDRDDEKGFSRRLGISTSYSHGTDFKIFGESDEINLGKIDNVQCDVDGIGTGDIAYAHVTLRDISLGGAVGAKLEKVERISDILSHIDGDTTGGQQMGR